LIISSQLTVFEKCHKNQLVARHLAGNPSAHANVLHDFVMLWFIVVCFLTEPFLVTSKARATSIKPFPATKAETSTHTDYPSMPQNVAIKYADIFQFVKQRTRIIVNYFTSVSCIENKKHDHSTDTGRQKC